MLDDILVSFDYLAVFPNEKLLQDVFRYSDSTYSAVKTRPVDKNMDFKLSKGLGLFEKVRVIAYVEVYNLLYDKWINFDAVERASQEDQKEFARSDLKKTPSVDVNGVPILETALYRNLPRSFLFGLSVEF